MKTIKNMKRWVLLVGMLFAMSGAYLFSGNCSASALMCDLTCVAVQPPGGSTHCVSGQFRVTCTAYDASGNVVSFINKQCPPQCI